MKIIILGGGQVGAAIAKSLASQSHNAITVIDQDEAILHSLSEHLDIQTMWGSASSPTVLEEAGAHDAELLLALTHSDEANLMACRLGKHIFNIPTRISRVRHSDMVEYILPNKDKEDTTLHSALELFDASDVICPEQLVTDQLLGLFQYGTALQVLNFAHGEAQMVATRAIKGGAMVGEIVKDLSIVLPENTDCHIFAIYRNDSLISPTPQTKIIHGDEIFFTAAKDHVGRILALFHPEPLPVRRIMIVGGGNIGYRLAKQAESRFDVKIIERNQQRAEWLSENLTSTLVLAGSGTDEKILGNEHIEDIDVFCALTDDDENNIMVALLAKKLGARRVVSIVNRASYVDLMQGNSIDIVVSPHLASVGSILAHIRRGDIESVYSLRRGEAEILEAVIHGTRKTSKIVGRPVSQIKWPHGCQLAAVVRQQEIIKDLKKPEIKEQVIQVISGHKEPELQENDHLIFFIPHRRLIPELEKMLQVKLGFF